MGEISIFRSITKLKCPSCRKGDLFLIPGLFTFKKILKMPGRCQYCGQKYEIEPGFWIGALWTSYPFIVMIETPFILAAISGVSFGITALVLAMTLTLFIFFPLTLRLGRSIWIHLFVQYRPINN
jgi:uncharacterized protein (DUF983 family)